MAGKEVLFVLVVFLLFVSSCAETGMVDGVVPQGLALRFVEGYPDNVLVENDNFNVNLKVLNSISQPVYYTLCVYGDRSDFYGGVPVSGLCKNQLNIEGSYKNQQGTITPAEEIVVFPDKSSSFSYTNLDKSVTSANIRAIAEYGVQSEHGVEVCVLEDREYQSETGAVCLAKETISGSGIVQEGFPLVVSKIEKDVRNVGGIPQIRVLIYLDKSSNGEIVREVGNKFDKISVDVFLRGTGSDFSCNNQDGDGRVVFREEDAIECRSDLDLGGNEKAYKDSLVINLGYAYRLEQKKEIAFDSGWEA